MSLRLIVVPKFIEAVRNSGMKEKSEYDYYNCLRAKLHKIEDDKVIFRTYLDDVEYWEYTFKKVSVGNIELDTIGFGYE